MTTVKARRLAIGVDSSTQSCKAVWVDIDTGQIVKSRSVPHPDGTSIDPEEWWRALERLDIEGDSDIVGISNAAQQHGMIALDEAHRPVHEALLWNDTRSAPQAEQLLAEFGLDYWTYEIGMAPVASLTVTKLAWLAQKRPELAAAVRQVLLPHDWLTARLLGSLEAPTTDRSDASGTGYFSVPDNAYRLEVIEWALGHVPSLPRVLRPFELAGVTRSGIPVGAGAGDNAAAALGLGAGDGEVIISIGTSGTVFASTPAKILDPSGRIAGFADATGQHLPILVTLNAARVLDATRNWLGVDHEAFDSMALKAPKDAGGLTFLPYLDGERSPNLPHATGLLDGLTRRNMEPGHLAQAAVLGVLCSLADSLDLMRDCGVSVQSVQMIGGGSQSRAVQAVAADLFGVPVRIPAPQEYVALGAARQVIAAVHGPDAVLYVRPHEATITPKATSWAADVRGQYRQTRLRRYEEESHETPQPAQQAGVRIS